MPGLRVEFIANIQYSLHTNITNSYLHFRFDWPKQLSRAICGFSPKYRPLLLRNVSAVET
jgi:hypothetical protein